MPPGPLPRAVNGANVRASQSLTFPSVLPEARAAPSGLNATLKAAPPCLPRVNFWRPLKPPAPLTTARCLVSLGGVEGDTLATGVPRSLRARVAGGTTGETGDGAGRGGGGEELANRSRRRSPTRKASAGRF